MDLFLDISLLIFLYCNLKLSTCGLRWLFINTTQLFLSMLTLHGLHGSKHVAHILAVYNNQDYIIKLTEEVNITFLGKALFT